MFEIFMAICALTALDCEAVHVRYGSTGSFDNIAIAGIDTRGEYHVVVNRHAVGRKRDSFIRQLMVHEIAHLVVYESDPTNTTHNEQFQEVCHDLTTKAGLRSHREICDSHSGASSQLQAWSARRRRE